MIHKKNIHLNTIAIIGTHLPRQCGIATFTSDLCDAVAAELSDQGQVVSVALDDANGGYTYPNRVRFQIRDNKLPDYHQAADFLNVHQFDVAVLQHEYGIFGGRCGAYITQLIKNLKMPVLTTLHTVLQEPSKEQRDIVVELSEYSDRLLVMSQKGRRMLVDVYGIPADKIAFVHHGIPDIEFADPGLYKQPLNYLDRKIILSFGLVHPGKGFELMIQAMPKIVERHPDALYLIVGATHPQVNKATNDSYRRSLEALVSRLELANHVRFENRFVDLDALRQFIGAADIYITPYVSPAQITSGTLAYAVGMGRAVVSTPYWYAEELLADGRGRLVPFGDSAAMAEVVNQLLSNDQEREAMRQKAYRFGREMTWKAVARRYLELALESLENQIARPRPHLGSSQDAARKAVGELPEVSLNHLRTLTDETGILQHATYTIPNRHHGYSLDDNARALIAASLFYSLRRDESVIPLIQKYLAFLLHAFNRETGRFRNFMSYDRHWLEEIGSEDSHGRALWGLGVAVKHAPTESARQMTTRLFLEGLPPVDNFTSPRAWAFALVGLHSYLDIYGGDSNSRRLFSALANRLYEQFKGNSDEEWLWCEDLVTYDNAKLPHALLVAGRLMPHHDMHRTGLAALKWLLKQKTAPDGHLSIIGNAGWLDRQGERSNFDQQPIDAMGLVEACVEAFRSTKDLAWLQEGRRCLNWFLGHNDLNLPLYDSKTGGCSDGLQPHGTNGNQGAESTLACLISLLLMFEVLN